MTIPFWDIVVNSFLGVVVNGAALYCATLSSGPYLRSRSTKFCVRGHVLGLGFRVLSGRGRVWESYSGVVGGGETGSLILKWFGSFFWFGFDHVCFFSFPPLLLWDSCCYFTL